jgi:GT2 family glycosyltransferase
MARAAMGGAGLETVKHLPFWCVLIRRSVLDRFGPLDTRFIHYASDSIYCDRVNAAGLRCVWVRAVYLAHQAHGSGRLGGVHAWRPQTDRTRRQ